LSQEIYAFEEALVRKLISNILYIGAI
jgi:hypothetical protein